MAKIAMTITGSKSVPEKLRAAFDEDIEAALDEARARYISDTRQAQYEMLQVAASVILYLKEKPGKWKKLERHALFAKMHVRPRGSQMILQLLNGARTKNARDRANRQAKAIDILLAEGLGIKSIADRLKARRGVSGVLGTLKTLVLDPSMTKPKRIEHPSKATKPKVPPTNEVAEVEEDDEAELEIAATRPACEFGSAPAKSKRPVPPKGWFSLIAWGREDDLDELLEADTIVLTCKLTPTPSGWKVIQIMSFEAE